MSPQDTDLEDTVFDEDEIIPLTPEKHVEDLRVKAEVEAEADKAAGYRSKERARNRERFDGKATGVMVLNSHKAEYDKARGVLVKHKARLKDHRLKRRISKRALVKAATAWDYVENGKEAFVKVDGDLVRVKRRKLRPEGELCKMDKKVLALYNDGKFEGQLEAIRADYLTSSVPIETIAKRYEVDVKLVKSRMREEEKQGRSWKRGRDVLMKGAVAAIIKSRAENLDTILGDALACTGLGLRELKSRAESGEIKFTIRDLRDLTSIVANLHNVESIEIGRPNNIVDFSKMSIEDIERTCIEVIGEIKDLDDLDEIAKIDLEGSEDGEIVDDE